MVELVDIYPTVSELAGLTIPDDVQGTSLIPVLTNPSAVVKPGALSFNNGYSFRTPQWHYMRYTDGTRELYDLKGDPGEFTNLAENPVYTNQLKQLNDGLKQRLANADIKEKSSAPKKRTKTKQKP